MKGELLRPSEIDPTELATIDDLEELPHGWDTVVRVSTLDGHAFKFARITDDGYIKTVDDEYVRREKNRLEVVGGGAV